jgi:flagellar biosynthesis protein FlhG
MAQEGVIKKHRSSNNHILAIGGGKGGTGKSLFAASLGISLAARGSEVLLVDADLGTANLHTFFGLEPPRVSLSDFVTRKRSRIDCVITKTGMVNLKLISGAKDMIGIANLSYGEKARILNNIKKLNYEFILMDLGPGTSFNVLDFFLISHSGILVTSPEPTSIENTYRFVKGLLFRYLRKVVNQNVVKTLIDQGVRSRHGHRFDSIFDLLEAIEKIDSKLGTLIENHLSAIDIKLVTNQARTTSDREIGQKIAFASKKYFGIHLDFLGNVSHDRNLREGLQQRKPLMAYYPHSLALKEIDQIGQRIAPNFQLALDFPSDHQFVESLSIGK